MTFSIPEKPESATWTDDQWKAIHASGQNILVAAAAGSGKTAVLVSRIIEKLKDETAGLQVDELLVVTFTNASAAEMKQRVEAALEKALQEDPDSRHLKKQIALLNYASISTLHSFCLDVIRKFYYVADIDPNFRLIEPLESGMIQDEVMEALLERHYGAEENERFFHLVDSFTNDRSDDVLLDILTRLYDFSRANPDPVAWLQQIASYYDTTELATVSELPFYRYIEADIRIHLEQALEELRTALKFAEEPGGPDVYLPLIENEKLQLEQLLDDYPLDWEAKKEAISSVKFGRLPTIKNKENYDEPLIDQTKQARDGAKKQLKAITEEWFQRDAGNYLADLAKMKPDIELLTELVEEFAADFLAEKQRRGVLDFNDLEHLALAILGEKTEATRYEPSEIALEYRHKFKEVLIDEYQDTNMVQETILSLLTTPSEAAGNLFMVGDVKQSIYRFRLAEPTLFLDKYKRYRVDGENTGIRIDLSKNFRSRQNVLTTTNFIFKQLMDTQIAEIDYDEAAELVLGAAFPETEERYQPEIALVDMKQEERESEETDSPQELQKNQAEAMLIARKIKKMITEKFQIYDKKMQQYRPIQYRDIVLLSRAMTSATDIEEAMKAHDIPFYANSNTGYFEATEIRIMLAVLKVIDNPYQDIPLAAVLRSPILGVSEEILGQIRAARPKGYFYDALLLYQQTTISPEADRIDRFLKQLELWRDLANRESLPKLIAQIYEETHYYDFVGGLPGGKQRQANLRALYDRSSQYEKTAYRGLFRFIRFIERMRVRGDDMGTAKTLGEKEDVVRMMTIHASKGLEFPVVILAGTSRRFNMRDIYSKYLLDKEFGFSARYNDVDKRIVYPTIMQQAIKQKKYRETIAEEMRVLYVALTRAEQKLIITGTVADWEKMKTKWASQSSHTGWILPAGVRLQGKTYLEWIGSAFARHPEFAKLLDAGSVAALPIDMPIGLEIVASEQLTNPAEAKTSKPVYLDNIQAGETVPIESPEKERITSYLDFIYPNQVETQIRAKQSVTEIKRQFSVQDSWSDTKIVEGIQKVSLDRPKFLQRKGLSATEKGTAMHTVMQSLPLSHEPDDKELTDFLEELVAKEILSPEQKESITYSEIQAFFRTKLGRLVNENLQQVEREIPFSYHLPASVIYPEAETEERVLIQGVIDCMLEEADGVTLIDYKTDRIGSHFPNGWLEAEPVLKKRYEVQMHLYQKAIEAITKKPVKHIYLYFFDGAHVCQLETEE